MKKDNMKKNTIKNKKLINYCCIPIVAVLIIVAIIYLAKLSNLFISAKDKKLVEKAHVYVLNNGGGMSTHNSPNRILLSFGYDGVDIPLPGKFDIILYRKEKGGSYKIQKIIKNVTREKMENETIEYLDTEVSPKTEYLYRTRILISSPFEKAYSKFSEEIEAYTCNYTGIYSVECLTKDGDIKNSKSPYEITIRIKNNDPNNGRTVISTDNLQYYVSDTPTIPDEISQTVCNYDTGKHSNDLVASLNFTEYSTDNSNWNSIPYSENNTNWDFSPKEGIELPETDWLYLKGTISTYDDSPFHFYDGIDDSKTCGIKNFCQAIYYFGTKVIPREEMTCDLNFNTNTGFAEMGKPEGWDQDYY
ncbi:MAG: hypothetical protein E7254_10855 [Lachnospiraceae bacterium]|nr:hypothetical protein [Lachnospiraceae bacterium]